MNNKKASKPLYLISNIAAIVLSWLVSIGLCIVIIIAAVQMADAKISWQSASAFMIPAIVLLVLGILFYAYSIAISSILLYKAWSIIQPSHPRTTAGKAVGFMFIPFFNLYWVFEAVLGFAKDYNASVSQSGITDFRLNEGLFLALCILFIATCIPYLGTLASIGLIVVGFICINNICDAINHYAAHDAHQINGETAIKTDE